MKKNERQRVDDWMCGQINKILNYVFHSGESIDMPTVIAEIHAAMMLANRRKDPEDSFYENTSFNDERRNSYISYFDRKAQKEETVRRFPVQPE